MVRPLWQQGLERKDRTGEASQSWGIGREALDPVGMEMARV